jgi:GNAT superfamily N-acetyltransferase
MLSGVLVRPRRPADLDPLLELTHRVKAADGYPPRGPVDVDGFIAPPQELAAWVAELDAQVVGHVALHDTGADDTMDLAAKATGRAPEQLALVARVLVSPGARRRGVAQALLATAVADAHDRGRHPVLEVAVHFDAAIALYESCGWERIGQVTIVFDAEPALERYVYVGPAPVAAGALTRP